MVICHAVMLKFYLQFGCCDFGFYINLFSSDRKWQTKARLALEAKGSLMNEIIYNYIYKTKYELVVNKFFCLRVEELSLFVWSLWIWCTLCHVWEGRPPPKEVKIKFKVFSFVYFKNHKGTCGHIFLTVWNDRKLQIVYIQMV